MAQRGQSTAPGHPQTSVYHPAASLARGNQPRPFSLLPADATNSLPLLQTVASASYMACEAPPLPMLALMTRTPGCTQAGRLGGCGRNRWVRRRAAARCAAGESESSTR